MYQFAYYGGIVFMVLGVVLVIAGVIVNSNKTQRSASERDGG